MTWDEWPEEKWRRRKLLSEPFLDVFERTETERRLRQIKREELFRRRALEEREREERWKKWLEEEERKRREYVMMRRMDLYRPATFVESLGGSDRPGPAMMARILACDRAWDEIVSALRFEYGDKASDMAQKVMDRAAKIWAAETGKDAEKHPGLHELKKLGYVERAMRELKAKIEEEKRLKEEEEARLRAEAKEFTRLLAARLPIVKAETPERIDVEAKRFAQELRERLAKEGLLGVKEITPLKVGLERPIVREEMPKIEAERRPSRLYHWWDEPDRARRIVKAEFLREVIKEAKTKLGCSSYRDLIINKLGCPRSEYETYRKWLKGRTTIETETQMLRRWCDAFNIPYERLEKDRLLERIFPIELGSPEVVKLKTSVDNDGHLQIDTEGNYRLFYYNKDPVLHRHFRRKVEKIGGSLSSIRFDGTDVTSVYDGTTARILANAGVGVGRKILRLSHLHEKVWTDSEIRKNHIAFTLAEEGFFSIRVRKVKRKIEPVIGWCRAVDLTEKLPKGFIEGLRPGQKYKLRLRKINEPIKSIVKENCPRLLREEYELLSKHHAGVKWRKPRPVGIYRRKVDGGVSVLWEFAQTNLGAIETLLDQYGIPEGTWKAIAWKERRKLIEKLGLGRLSAGELELAKRVLSEYPADVPLWWIETKMKEYFGA